MMIEQLPSDASVDARTHVAPPSRRAFIRNTALVGGGTAAALLLSGCTSDSEPGSEPGTEGSANSAEPFTFPAAEVPVGGGVVLTEHEVVVTQPETGTFHAFSAICTHKGCVLVSVEERGAYCGCHSSYFDIATGDPVAGPAQSPLPSVPVALSGDTLTIG